MFFCFQTLVPLKKYPGYHAYTFSDEHEAQNFCTAEVNKYLAIDFRAAGQHNFTL